MRKRNNPRLNGAVVSGTGLSHPIRPHVIVGDTSKGYVRGDLVDANAIKEIEDSLTEKIDNIEKKVDISDESINTVKEVYNFLDGMEDSAKLVDVLNSSTPRIKVTYAELLDLADNYKLIPGKEYQLIDYEFTWNTDLKCTSGPGQFDLVLTANSTDILNEHCKATWHDGDEYFYDQKLDQWEIWYNLYNDYRTYPWCSIYRGKGVIYRMIDESGNDLPYDFKHMKFEINGSGIAWGFTREDSKETYSVGKWLNSAPYKDYGYLYTFCGPAGSDVDYSLWRNSGTDENNLEPPYSSNCIVKQQKYATNNVTNTPGYTSGNNVDYGVTHSTDLFQPNLFVGPCGNITLEEGCAYNILIASNNVVFGRHCVGNVFVLNDSKFGNNCCDNTITDDCVEESKVTDTELKGRNIVFGNDCNKNQITLKNEGYYTDIYDKRVYLTIYAAYITLKDSCNNNEIIDCYVTLENNVSDQTINWSVTTSSTNKTYGYTAENERSLTFFPSSGASLTITMLDTWRGRYDNNGYRAYYGEAVYAYSKIVKRGILAIKIGNCYAYKIREGIPNSFLGDDGINFYMPENDMFEYTNVPYIIYIEEGLSNGTTSITAVPAITNSLPLILDSNSGATITFTTNDRYDSTWNSLSKNIGKSFDIRFNKIWYYGCTLVNASDSLAAGSWATFSKTNTDSSDGVPHLDTVTLIVESDGVTGTFGEWKSYSFTETAST